MNGAPVIYGLIVLIIGWILIAKYERGGGHGHGYYYATSRIGSSFRMWAVDKSTRKRG